MTHSQGALAALGWLLLSARCSLALGTSSASPHTRKLTLKQNRGGDSPTTSLCCFLFGPRSVTHSGFQSHQIPMRGAWLPCGPAGEAAPWSSWKVHHRSILPTASGGFHPVTPPKHLSTCLKLPYNNYHTTVPVQRLEFCLQRTTAKTQTECSMSNP